MDTETAEFESSAEAFAAQVAQLERLLLPLVSAPFEELLEQHVQMIDRASLCVLFAYIINSLAFLYLRTQGATKGHPVRKELARVKEYMEKVSTAAGANKAPMQLDQDAAKRFIKHTLSNNPELKGKYKEQEAELEADKFLSSILADSSSKPISKSTPKAGKRERNTTTDLEKKDTSRKKSKPLRNE